MSEANRVGWHIIMHGDGRVPRLSHGDDREVRLNKPRSVSKHLLNVGSFGLHYSTNLITAVRNIRSEEYCARICRIQAKGKVVGSEFFSDTFAASTRIVTEWKAGVPVFRQFADFAPVLMSDITLRGDCLEYFDSAFRYINFIGQARIGQNFFVTKWTGELLGYMLDLGAAYYGYGDGGAAYRKYRDAIEAKLVELYEAAPALGE